jgi:hypothetical protein
MSRAQTQTPGPELVANPATARVIKAPSAVDVNLADEAIAYEYEMTIVDIREARNGPRSGSEWRPTGFSEAKERTRMMHWMWR